MAKLTVQQSIDPSVSARELAWLPFSASEARARLEDGELRLFCAPICLAPAVPTAWLDAQEHRRCRSYRFAADRQRHLLAHGLKRWAIGGVLDAPPSALRFTASELGKPALVDDAVHFSLSHSAGWVALALYREAAVGIDVEGGCDASTSLPLWPDITHPEELTPNDMASFLVSWTLKEAISKCSGEGLTLDFRRLFLRLQAGHRFLYSGTDGARHWCAGHSLLDANTHLAYASGRQWDSVKACLVSSFG